MCFRIAVREVEAWLLADRERIASFLGVSPARVPRDPDGLDDPKLEMVNLARHSSRRVIRKEMTPRPGSGISIGPAYSLRLIEFASKPDVGWRPEVAAGHSRSLRRCVAALRTLTESVH